MKKNFIKGFTLLELITVIAVITILASITLTVGPRMIERAKLRRLDNALRQVATALAAYYADNATYPPAYGYVGSVNAHPANAPANAAGDPSYYNLMPYMFRLREHGSETMYDQFSSSYDTDRDGRLSLLEFSPHGRRQPDGSYAFEWNSWPRYLGQVTPALAEDIERQLSAQSRPFIYLPVNKQQFSRAQKYWLAHHAEYAQRWDPNDPDFPNLTFPPRTYDAYVLISVGPGGSTFGLLPEPLGVPPEQANNYRDLYHITALRAYFMATRDLNANGILDFDYRARTQRREGSPANAYTFGNKQLRNELPDPVFANSYGPYIFASEWNGSFEN